MICTIISIILILVIEDSTWIPCGYSMWNGGIHMEYRWKKIIEMGEISAKTYSMWNGQIPCGTTWIPCGIRGQGKDLQITQEMCWTRHLSGSWRHRQNLYHRHLISENVINYCKIVNKSASEELAGLVPESKYYIVLGSRVPRLEKDWDQTGPGLTRTGKYQDWSRLQLQSSLQSISILQTWRPTKNRFKPVSTGLLGPKNAGR